MTRAEHLQWCKDRALEYLETGDTTSALSSMFSDLNKHPETEDEQKSFWQTKSAQLEAELASVEAQMETCSDTDLSDAHLQLGWDITKAYEVLADIESELSA